MRSTPAKPDNDPDFSAFAAKPNRIGRLTFIEAVAIIGVIAIMIGLLLPVLCSDLRSAHDHLRCPNNLKQIALALHSYEQAHGVFPPAHSVDANGKPLHSWRTLILPYLEQDTLYRTIDLSKPWNDPVNMKAVTTDVSVYRCPESRRPSNMTTYVAIVGPNACFKPEGSRRRSEITDHPHSTLLVVEAADEESIYWMAPEDAIESLVTNIGLGPKTQIHHDGFTNGCCVDGSVRLLKSNTSQEVWRALVSISGNDDEITKDW